MRMMIRAMGKIMLIIPFCLWHGSGGAASKNGTLRVGDQIISVNGCDVTSMSRIEAWNLMKKLPDGAVSLIIRQQITSS